MVYGTARDVRHNNSPFYLRGKKCVITLLTAEDELLVQAESDNWEYGVHPKQVRKLKPKSVAREFWIKPSPTNYSVSGGTTFTLPVIQQYPPSNVDGFIHVKEVVEKPKRETKT